MSILVLLLFFSLLLIIVYGDTEKRFLSLIAGTILFANVSLFIKNPSLSPQHILLYAFIFFEYFKNGIEFRKNLLKNPLIIPLFLILFSMVASAFFNGGIVSKDMYYGVRDFVDTFSYLIVALYCGKNIAFESVPEKLWKFLIVCCILGIAEGLLNANYPYKIINSAFPYYEGLYNLNTDVSLSQDWRIRTCFTTKHPTAFGTLLVSLFFFYLPLIKTQILSRYKVLLLLALLAVNIVMCGSRTALLCLFFGLALLLFDKVGVVLKIIIVGLMLLSFTTIMGIMMENFWESRGAGGGSSLDYRMRQLIFSVESIVDAPIFGNGNKYAANYILQETDAGGKEAEDAYGENMGGLESIVFTLLIDRGAVGLLTYFLLMLWMFVLLFKYRKLSDYTTSGFALIGASFVYVILSGVIGNSSNFFFLFSGFQLGYIALKREEADEEMLTTENEILESEKAKI